MNKIQELMVLPNLQMNRSFQLLEAQSIPKVDNSDHFRQFRDESIEPNLMFKYLNELLQHLDVLQQYILEDMPSRHYISIEYRPIVYCLPLCCSFLNGKQRRMYFTEANCKYEYNKPINKFINKE